MGYDVDCTGRQIVNIIPRPNDWLWLFSRALKEPIYWKKIRKITYLEKLVKWRNVNGTL